MALFVAAAAENPEQHQEQVDEVQVELERSENRSLAHGTGIDIFRLGEGHVLDVLGVVGREPYEHQNADVADDRADGWALEKLGVQALPTSILVGTDGIVKRIHVGEITRDILDTLVIPLLELD